MDKRTILLSAQFDRKVASLFSAMADDKESFAATMSAGRRSPTAQRNIIRNVERWCDERHQITMDIHADNEALRCEPDNGAES
jgi:hypothetical protein